MISRRDFCKLCAVGTGAIIGGLSPLLVSKTIITVRVGDKLIGAMQSLTFTEHHGRVKGFCNRIKFDGMMLEEVFYMRHIHPNRQRIPFQVDIEAGISQTTVANLWLDYSRPIVIHNTKDLIVVDEFPFEAEKIMGL